MSKTTFHVGRFIDGVRQLQSFETPDDVANFFRSIGYKGSLHKSSRDCVAARFLMDCTGDIDGQIVVSPWDITYRWQGKDANFLDSLMIHINDTGALAIFMLRFDEKRYPDLVDDPEPVPA